MTFSLILKKPLVIMIMNMLTPKVTPKAATTVCLILDNKCVLEMVMIKEIL